MRGLEPLLRKEHDPKSCASASSATSAVYFSMSYKFYQNAGITFSFHFASFFGKNPNTHM